MLDVANPPAFEAPPVAEAMFVGGATALVPFVAGSSIAALGAHIGVRNGGLLLAQTGFVAAPFVAHGVVGEWRRGLAFSAAPALGASGVAAIVVARPAVFSEANLSLGLKYLFVGVQAVTMAASMFGVFDVAGAGARRRGHLSISLVPQLSSPGLSAVGTW